MHSDIFRICDNPPFSKLCSLSGICLYANRTHTRYRCKSATSFLLPFCFVEICDAFFGDDVTDVIAIDHDRGDWHSCLLANFHCVERFNERRNTTLLKRCHGLYHELSTANDWLVLGNQIEPGG